MAHEILKGDIVYCLEEEGSWHKKHIVPENNIITADLNDWKPQVSIPYLRQPNGEFAPIENTKIITRLLNGTRIPLGVGTDRYEPIANS